MDFKRAVGGHGISSTARLLESWSKEDQLAGWLSTFVKLKRYNVNIAASRCKNSTFPTDDACSLGTRIRALFIFPTHIVFVIYGRTVRICQHSDDPEGAGDAALARETDSPRLRSTDPTDLGTHKSVWPVRPRYEYAASAVSEMMASDTTVGSRPKTCLLFPARFLSRSWHHEISRRLLPVFLRAR